MEIKEAKEGLLAALQDIEKLPGQRGFSTESKCLYSNSDDEDSESYEGAECIFGQITVTPTDGEDSVIFSTAVCIFEKEDGEYTVSAEELATCIQDIREEVKEFFDSVDAIATEKGLSPDEAYKERIAPATETDEVSGGQDNSKFYIIASVVALIVLIALVIWRNMG